MTNGVKKRTNGDFSGTKLCQKLHIRGFFSTFEMFKDVR